MSRLEYLTMVFIRNVVVAVKSSQIKLFFTSITMNNSLYDWRKLKISNFFLNRPIEGNEMSLESPWIVRPGEILNLRRWSIVSTLQIYSQMQFIFNWWLKTAEIFIKNYLLLQKPSRSENCCFVLYWHV